MTGLKSPAVPALRPKDVVSEDEMGVAELFELDGPVESVILPFPLSAALPPRNTDRSPPVMDDFPASSIELAMA